ncbi:MAG: phosphohydrolase [Sphingomonadaceae bacterium]|nr:phosphohydrolase [Sphingomonadaceae bacterium]
MTPENASQRPFVLLPSGRVIDLADPSPDSWSDEDLAIGLSRTHRWGGHSRWPRPLTVAQHSLTVLAVRLQGEPDLAPAACLYELLHDAEEGLLGFDCIAPMKAFLGAPFAALASQLTNAVARRYDLPTLDAEDYRRHKRADRIAAASEAHHVTAWTPSQIAATLQLTKQPLTHDPLFAADATSGFAEWEPWPADVAAAAWLDALRTLVDARDQEHSR